MATGTNAIATELEVKSITGSTNTSIDNKCCTKSRAITLGADSSYLTSYNNNQLVKYSDIYARFEETKLSVIFNCSGNNTYNHNGGAIVAKNSTYSFSDISNPSNTTEDIDWYAEVWLNQSDCYNIPGTIISDTATNTSDEVEICVILNYSPAWNVEIYMTDLLGGYVSNSDFDIYLGNNYIVGTYQGYIQGEILVKWSRNYV